jgi:hypothetical protein
MKFLAAALCLSTALFGATVEGERSGEVRLVPMERTAEPEATEIRIAFPSEGEVKTENPVRVQLRVENYPLGYPTGLERDKQIRNSRVGQAVHIILDGKHYFAVNEAIDEMTESEQQNLDQTIEYVIPYKVTPGLHVLRAFLVRSYGECLKGTNCFESGYFYFGKGDNKQTDDLSKPYLTYNTPEGEFSGDKPILLDFYLSNAQLSKDGYKVRLIIDGKDKRMLTEWVPYYIYGLKKGSHTIELELLDPSNNVIPPLFKDLKQTIVVK